MELYRQVAYELSRHLTRRYSTSFSLSSRLFDRSIRADIYAIYGLVRIADEIVDSYLGPDETKQTLLVDLERETYQAIERGYSPNPIVHAFALTAKQYTIDETLIKPFFDSMKLDIADAYQPELYEQYIYGSAEVVGLMCLRVFTGGDHATYQQLEPGARLLGSAYQKVNFLRDFGQDYRQLGRIYFPGVEYDGFDAASKLRIEAEIEAEFKAAGDYIDQLPTNARTAVRSSWRYYHELLTKIKQASADELKSRRIRVGTRRKAALFAKSLTSRSHRGK